MSSDMGIGTVFPVAHLGMRALPGLETDDLEERCVLSDRLLIWLLKHPFQRAEDLGLVFQTPRSSVYRHLARLSTRALVESVTLSRERNNTQAWYYLTTTGLCRVASLVHADPAKLAQMWGAHETALLRLLPRLHGLIMLQQVLNGLIGATPIMLTYPNGHPAAIRWHWVRDYQATFYDKQTRLQAHVDAALVLARRPLATSSADESEYYTLFLLSDPGLNGNEDLQLIQNRLGRLLRFRESAERWSHYHAFPPLLVLVSNQRQQEVWQHCVREAATACRLAPLAGAIVTHTAEEGLKTSWTLPWQTLAHPGPCRLQDILYPMSRDAIPPGLLAPKVAPAGTFRPSATLPSRTPRTIVKGQFQDRAAHRLAISDISSRNRENIALLGLRLSRRHLDLLRLIYAFPLLSATELAIMADLKVSSVAVYLSHLRQWQCIRASDTACGQRFLLAERGLRLMAVLLNVSLLHLCEIRAHWEDTPLRQRGVQRLQRLIRHTAGIYGFLTTLTRQARTQEHTLAWWETGARCARRYHYQGAWHNLRPDALFEYQAQEHCHRVWLEWDEGSMRRSQLQTKLEAYATYVRSRQWYAEAPRLPLLMFVVPEYDQEVRVTEIVQRVLGKSSVVVYTTTAALLTQRGPLSAIWKLVLPITESKHDTRRVCWI